MFCASRHLHSGVIVLLRADVYIHSTVQAATCQALKLKIHRVCGLQTMDPADEDKFDFDPLDVTKIWPEELFPLQPVGRLVLNKNVDNFFAENEQLAFAPGVVVPGVLPSAMQHSPALVRVGRCQGQSACVGCLRRCHSYDQHAGWSPLVSLIYITVECAFSAVQRLMLYNSGGPGLWSKHE